MRDSVATAGQGRVDLRRDTGELSQCAGPLVCQIDILGFIERVREVVDRDLEGLYGSADIGKRLAYVAKRCFGLLDLQAGGVQLASRRREPAFASIKFVLFVVHAAVGILLPRAGGVQAGLNLLKTTDIAVPLTATASYPVMCFF